MIYVRYLRHRLFERLRHGKKFLAWLSEQSARLSTTEDTVTPDEVFELLKVFSIGEIEAATSYADFFEPEATEEVEATEPAPTATA
jgi:hypothetical protein